MIFCLFREQAEMLIETESYEIDMSYKRVKDPGVNEVVFAKFIEQQSKGKSSGYLSDTVGISTRYIYLTYY